MVLGFSGVLLFEMVPFSPILTSFRPIWDWPRTQTQLRPEPGNTNEPWHDWGVNVAMTANTIEYYREHSGLNLAPSLDCSSSLTYTTGIQDRGFKKVI